ncbi:hypothetical protein B0T16DRAFT_205155 [Cercophora newfieldiana]|uniref:Uncharacterized protein n=1 Tax=Cercophora newfieldiana TaxID=92897 RepID=A0AA40CJB1_9PEZI|nr:hypothetical protein B0T16DRAFT_205155 [Cercophora newfieldiana]
MISASTKKHQKMRTSCLNSPILPECDGSKYIHPTQCDADSTTIELTFWSCQYLSKSNTSTLPPLRRAVQWSPPTHRSQTPGIHSPTSHITKTHPTTSKALITSLLSPPTRHSIQTHDFTPRRRQHIPVRVRRRASRNASALLIGPSGHRSLPADTATPRQGPRHQRERFI